MEQPPEGVMAFAYLVIFMLIVALPFYQSWRNSPKQKGRKGEKHVARSLSKLQKDYIIMNDIVFPTEKGTTQIDHIVLSRYAVFAIETKNYEGEIYGEF